MAALQPGAHIRDYVIDSLIGGGGMGEVYLATDINLNRKVAIKVLRPEHTHDQSFAQRFRNEAQVQARLNHPHIVTLYSFFEEGGTYYIILEYAPGITLDTLMRQVGIIPEERAMRIFQQICEALAYAHKSNVVHRDIKPSNIMVDVQNGDSVKVMDFGIARIMDAGHITRTGAQMGTVNYMSPEQVLAVKDVDHRTDIYSAGIVLYEMLSGRLPYDTDTESPYKVQEQIVKAPMPDPRGIYGYISPQAVALLELLTQKDRANRPADIMQALQPRRAQIVPPPNMQPVTPKRAVMETKLQIPTEAEIKPRQDYAEPVLVPPRQRSRLAWLWLVLAVLVVVGVVLLKPWNMLKKQAEEQFSEMSEVPMVEVGSGEFVMGSEEGEPDETPRHTVFIHAFYISPYEVTQGEWESVMGFNNSQFPGTNRPVDSVTWFQALEFCNKRSIAEGLQPCYTIAGNRTVCDFDADGYRLPTEAEWEYAAVGGPSRSPFLYAGSNDIDAVGWYESNSSATHPVGEKAPNSLGLYDITGNVREWCWDWYGKNYQNMVGIDNPRGPATGIKRQTRGGSYQSNAYRSRVTFRAYGDPSEPRNGGYGFRLARSTSSGK